MKKKKKKKKFRKRNRLTTILTNVYAKAHSVIEHIKGPEERYILGQKLNLQMFIVIFASSHSCLRFVVVVVYTHRTIALNV